MVSSSPIETGSDSRLTAAPKPVTIRTYALSFLLMLAMLAPTLLYPIGRDTSNYLYVARTIAHGGVPYRDSWEIKPPGIFILLAPVTRLFPGPSLVWGAHLADIAVCGAVGVLLIQLANAYGTPAAGWAAAAWYATFYLEGGYGNLVETEGWANPAALATILLCLRAIAPNRRDADRNLLWAGMLAGVATLVKFTMLPPLAPFILLALWRRHNLRAIAAFIAGFAIPLAATFLWLHWCGAWPAYLDSQRHFVVAYIAWGAAPPVLHFTLLLQFVLSFVAWLWLPSVFFVVALRSRNWPAQLKLPTLTALGLTLVAIWVQQKCILYYWQAFLPLTCLLVALGSLELMRVARVPARRQAAIAVLIALAWHAYRYVPEYALAARYATGSLNSNDWWAHFPLPGEIDPVGKAYRAANYAARHTNRDDTILVFGWEPIIYFLSDRPAPNPFFWNPPVVSNYANPLWRDQFLRDLRARPPRLVLLRHGDSSTWTGGSPGESYALFRGSPPLEAWLTANYHLARDDAGFAYFALNDSGASQFRPSENIVRNPSK